MMARIAYLVWVAPRWACHFRPLGRAPFLLPPTNAEQMVPSQSQSSLQGNTKPHHVFLWSAVSKQQFPLQTHSFRLLKLNSFPISY